jgi:hypothetical protein
VARERRRGRTSLVAELVWFFSLPEGWFASFAFPVRRGLGAADALEEPFEGSCVAYTAIRAWLLRIADHDAGVLKAAYTSAPWPDELVSELGPLTGIVVRLASVEAGWPDGRSDRDTFELRVAARLAAALRTGNPGVVRTYRQPARAMLSAALKAYALERRQGWPRCDDERTPRNAPQEGR